MKSFDIVSALTASISTVTNNYVTADNRPLDDRRVFAVEDINDNWAVEIPFNAPNGTRPLCFRAVVYGGLEQGTVMSFTADPDEQGLDHLTRWFRAVLELGL